MKAKKVVMEQAQQASLQEYDFDAKVEKNQILVRHHYSLVSAGTETAIYKGTESWAQFPCTAGYTSVGEVADVGPDVQNFKKGDLVFAGGAHSTYGIYPESPSSYPILLPKGSDLRKMVYTRMAAVSMTALRVSEVELGDWAVVQGVGSVGNCAAQMLALQGANVIAIDIAQKRLDIAKKCNIEHTANPDKQDLVEAVKELTGGKGVNTVVEATGVPALVERCFALCAPLGELILLGSPRGEFQSDLTAFMNNVHLWGPGCITLKGAHEWRYPTAITEGSKHSISRNCHIIIDLIARGKLVVEPLMSHVESPEKCQELHQGLLNKKDEYVSVIYDWTKV